MYKEGDLVAIQRTQFGTGLILRPKFLGPYKITKVNSRDRYEVEKKQKPDCEFRIQYATAWMEDKDSSSSMNRYNRQLKYREVLNAPLTEIENGPPILKLDTKDVECQTDLTFQEISEMEKKLHVLETNFVNILINIHKMRFLPMQMLSIFTPSLKMLHSSLRC
ncbi:hypothetical protein TNIN_300641 [Trichonephila inaurata madagascariensis]|uniref:Uncharacterized protein n=1 Tax=Trichonephila inaurata madagascariensis TaxID=2747483 RepID=A0A8X7C6Q6_9ARAC|nr:hypothetical protein TNIN_300641 [Trichonephila inaurata madagascariensis]